MRIPGLGINTNEVALASEHELGPWIYSSNGGRERVGLVGIYSLGRLDGHEKLSQGPLQAKSEIIRPVEYTTAPSHSSSGKNRLNYTAHFTLNAGGIEACDTAYYTTEYKQISPCASAEFGMAPVRRGHHHVCTKTCTKHRRPTTFDQTARSKHTIDGSR